MKNCVIKVAVPIGLLVLCVAIVLLVGAGTGKGNLKDYVLTVNGSPVLEEEFFLLLRENTIQYENQLRTEHKIPGEQSVRAYFDGDEGEYRRLLLEQNIACLTAIRVEQALATEYGVMPEFTYEAFLEELNAENRRREEALAKGEPIYGLRSFSPEQYYSYKMSNLRTAVLRAVPDELLAVSDEDMDAYYKGLDTYAGVDGETIHYTLYDVTAVQALPAEMQNQIYDGIAATLVAGTYLDVVADGVAYPPEKRAFTPNELRNFVRQDFSAEFLLSLAVGEVCGPFSLGDHIYIAQYNGFEKAKTLQDNDRAGFENTLRKEAYESLIAQKTAQADVKVNQKAMIEEEEK